MLYAAASTRHGIGSIIATISAQHRVLAAPCFAGAVAPFSSSCGSSSSLSESSSNSPRPSSDDDRQDIDRYINEQPKADGPVPTAIEQEEATRAAAGEHIFTEGTGPAAHTQQQRSILKMLARKCMLQTVVFSLLLCLRTCCFR
jgi:hypothetical protein